VTEADETITKSNGLRDSQKPNPRYLMTSLDKFLPIIGVLVLLAYLTGYTFGRRRIQADENTGEAVVRRLLSTVFAGNDYHLMNNMVFL
jgi:hypothetical protein